MVRRNGTTLRLVALATTAMMGATAPAMAQGTLRIAMTATDVPTTTGVPNNGFEGVRFMGYTAFDALVNWDLSKADKPADITPGLAESWEQSKSDTKKWTFKLRQGVTVPRRHALQRRCGRMEPRSKLQQGREAVRSARFGDQSRTPDVYRGRRLQKDRRLHDRIHDDAADFLFPLRPDDDLLRQPGGLRESRKLGRVRQSADRHRPLHRQELQAAHQHRSRQESKLLEQGAHSQSR